MMTTKPVKDASIKELLYMLLGALMMLFINAFLIAFITTQCIGLLAYRLLQVLWSTITFLYQAATLPKHNARKPPRL